MISKETILRKIIQLKDDAVKAGHQPSNNGREVEIRGSTHLSVRDVLDSGLTGATKIILATALEQSGEQALCRIVVHPAVLEDARGGVADIELSGADFRAGSEVNIGFNLAEDVTHFAQGLPIKLVTYSENLAMIQAFNKMRTEEDQLQDAIATLHLARKAFGLT